MTTETKVCTSCGEEKPLSEFTKKKDYRNPDNVYRHAKCKQCMVEYTRSWVKKNKERWNEYQRDYNRKRREKRNEVSES